MLRSRTAIWGLSVSSIPTGVFCDLFGRKRTFLVSCVLMLLSLAVILMFPNVTGALGGLIIQGLSRAFSSGSLDALVIEQGREKCGETALAKINGELNILESLGIAAGSLAGGILAGVGNQYRGNIFCMAGCYIVITVLVIFYTHERFHPKTEEKRNIWKQAAESISYTLHMQDLRRLMILIFISGMVFFSIETYWQPAFTVLPGSDKSWELGLVTFSGFVFTAVGSRIAVRLLADSEKETKKHWWKVLFLMRMATGLCVILFALQKHVMPFIVAYSAVYLFHGSSGVVENSLLSRVVPDNLRASIMSLFSLLFQSGALAASGIAGVLMTALGIADLWILSGGFLILMLLFLIIIFYKSNV